MIAITETIELDESELEFQFARSSGPGGQHVNKVESAVQLRFDVVRSNSLPAPVKHRLVQLAGNRMTKDGHLLIEARKSRSQLQNKADAIDVLVGLIRKATLKPRTRRKSRPSLAARQRRRDQKRRRSTIKKLRRRVSRDHD